jgi:hypothetical protein
MRGAFLEASQGQCRIAIEIKSFTLPTISTDLYMAVGHSFCYHAWLRRVVPDRVLYLAVPDHIISTVFLQRVGQAVQEDYGRIRLIGFDPTTERVVRWIE